MASADGNEQEEQSLVGDNQAGLQRLASLLKGTAPDALLPSPDASPKAANVPAEWETFALVRPWLHHDSHVHDQAVNNPQCSMVLTSFEAAYMPCELCINTVHADHGACQQETK